MKWTRLSKINLKKSKPTNRERKKITFDTATCRWRQKTKAEKAYAAKRRRRNRAAKKSRAINRAVLLALLVSPAPSFAQDCLVTLASCDACVLASGGVTLSNCGGAAGGECPAFPPSLLAAAVDVEPGSLHDLLVDRHLALWMPGGDVYDVLTDPRRSFLRRAEHEIIQIMLEVYPDSGASPDQLREAALLRLKNLISTCLGHMVVRNVPDGTGGTAPALMPPGSGTRGQCSSALMGWLPRQLGEFTDRELSPFAEARAFSMTAAEEAREEKLVGLAAQLRELSAEDLGEVLDHAALMGADPEGGRR